jgi:hypothetical protein
MQRSVRNEGRIDRWINPASGSNAVRLLARHDCVAQPQALLFHAVEQAPRPHKLSGQNSERKHDGDPAWAWSDDHHNSDGQQSKPENDLQIAFCLLKGANRQFLCSVHEFESRSWPLSLLDARERIKYQHAREIPSQKSLWPLNPSLISMHVPAMRCHHWVSAMYRVGKKQSAPAKTSGLAGVGNPCCLSGKSGPRICCRAKIRDENFVA